MAEKLRVVMVGCGGWSGAWFKSVKQVKEVELVGLVDRRLEAAEGRKAEFKLIHAKTGTDLKQMLRQTKPDSVFDATPHKGHYPVTMEALKAGCHVLGEKPLAHSMAAARAMLDLARKKKLIFAVTQQRRYDANLQAWKAFLKSGKLGQVHSLLCDFYMPIFPRNGFNWVKNPLLLDMAIHTFDAARCILGADAETVYCKEYNPPQSPMHRGGSAIAIFEMSNKAVYEYRGSWANVGLNTTWEAGWLAQGTKGSSAWDGAKCYRTQALAGQRGWGMKLREIKVPAVHTAKAGGHVGLIREFIGCVRTGRRPETDASDNIKSLAMVFAAIKSAETGKKVRVGSI